MSKTCNKCRIEEPGVTVPYIVHEAGMARKERNVKRLWVIIIILIAILVGSNVAWTTYYLRHGCNNTTTVIEQCPSNG